MRHCSRACETTARDAARDRYRRDDAGGTTSRVIHQLQLELAKEREARRDAESAGRATRHDHGGDPRGPHDHDRGDGQRAPYGATPPRAEGQPLITPEAARQSRNIMTTLLVALGLQPEDMAMRPHLYACVQAAGHDTTYPFEKMIGEPMDLDLEMMMDGNEATVATKVAEQRSLQAAMRGDEGHVFEANKKGELQMVTGKKPKLEKPKLDVHITTQEQLIASLRNLEHHYTSTGDDRRAGLIGGHANCMRTIWHQGRFMRDDKSFLAFEERLRTHRCRLSTSDDWSALSSDPASTEATLLTESIYEVHTRHLGNSSRPGKVQPGATTPAKQGACREWARSGTCARGASCKFSHTTTKANPSAQTTHVPIAFTQAHGSKRPKICLRFAYFGTCNRASGAQCTDGGGGAQLHTCVHCKFKNGKHTLKEGKHPSGTCP
jgi:hypothetical protein